MIRHYIIWRIRNAHDRALRELVNAQTLPDAAPDVDDLTTET